MSLISQSSLRCSTNSKRPISARSVIVCGHFEPKTASNSSSLNRRLAISSSLGALFFFRSDYAKSVGLESIQLPSITTPDIVIEIQKKNQATIDNAEESFQSSDLLKTLKERSDANKDQRAKELRDKYCIRQAELGVGDCAGLRLIPGATKSGVQKRPDWMENMLGNDSQ